MDDKKKRQQDMTLRNMYFNRYLSVRYITALFLLINLNWFIVLVVSKTIFAILPLILLIVTIPVLFEQYKLYHHHQNIVPHTNRYIMFQMLVNVCLGVFVFTPFFVNLFPFMADTTEGKLFLIILLVMGILLCLYSQKRLEQIKNNKDRHFSRIQKMQQHY